MDEDEIDPVSQKDVVEEEEEDFINPLEALEEELLEEKREED